MKRSEKQIKAEYVKCVKCKHSKEFIGNSNYCEAQLRRVCSCKRYGRLCEYYKPK